MEKIIGLLQSPSTSLSSPLQSPRVQELAATAEAINAPNTMPPGTSRLEALPAEIINHILAFLPPLSLVTLSSTCCLLRSHAHNDLLWMSFVRSFVPSSDDLQSPSPAKSWRDLYIRHHPYWFLVRHKIWFADVHNYGLLILARYNSKNGCIEAFRLLAEHGTHTFETWTHNPEVIIHSFNPRVSLWLDDPVVKLNFQEGDHHSNNRLWKEVAMETGRTHGICSMISLCRPIPKALQATAMALWPAATVPAKERVRNESATKFRSEEHRPQRLEQMSDQTFRIRKWMEFYTTMQPSSAVRMGEEVMTFSTLLEESYTPTEKKPWQGIWVGDYSGHGCEFLLVLQREVTSPMALSRTSSTGSLPQGMALEMTDADEALQDSDRIPQAEESTESCRNVSSGNIAQTAGPSISQPGKAHAEWDEKECQGTNDLRDDDPSSSADTPSGRLEAIKLTGDVNVPRGEYTWIAEDIGPNGLIRVANEQMFVGARTVKSWGHIAGRGYRNDRFIPSQLIMISHDSLAQYWEDFGHISFYKRVNIDDYLTK